VAEAGVDGFKGSVTKLGIDEANLLAQKAALEAEKALKEKRLAEFKTKGLTENITRFKSLYGAGPVTKKYTSQEI